VAYIDWGNTLSSEDQEDLAIEKYQKAIELNPNLAIAYAGWGRALYFKGKYDLAIEKCQKAIELDPKYAAAYRGWGMALEAKGDAEHATTMYRRGFTLNPSDKCLKSKLGPLGTAHEHGGNDTLVTTTQIGRRAGMQGGEDAEHLHVL
jgi:tetratricopeptide (TPR) repeat protein